ncbi:MAG: methyltransferase [Kiritimatiellae bacterium]|jgi:hypothetical protein|nr:methyltransferase [Kiritimatiellia bacterium]
MTPKKIMDLANAFYGSATLFTASDAGVFKALAGGKSLCLEEIAEQCGVNERAIRLLLDGCVAVELLSKTGNCYKNTVEAETFLNPDSPVSLAKSIRYNRDVYYAWGKLPQFLESGEPVERPSLHLGERDDRTRAFALSMFERAYSMGQAVIPMLDLSKCKTLLDVGGGPGAYSMLCVSKWKQLSSTVIELPAIAAIANELIAERGLDDRVKTIPGSYVDTEFPVGQDAVNFFGVLHQESPQTILDLCTKAFDALNPGGQINIMDMMTDETRTAPAFSALFALNMALTKEAGWVFSDVDVIGWLKSVGFVDCNVQPLPEPMPHWLAMARKPI